MVVHPSSHGDSSCPAVLWIRPPSLNFAYRTLTLFGAPSHTLQLARRVDYDVRTPGILLPLVWPLPISLATTFGISVDVFSWPYLDVSVHRVPHVRLLIHLTLTALSRRRVSPFGHPWLVACLQLPMAFRSLPRPSSALGAKASALCSF